jgi:fatty acid desaturase
MGMMAAMNPPSSLLREEPPLADFTAEQRQPAAIDWYRSPLPPGAMKALHERSNFQGAVQTLGFLAAYLAPAAAAIWSAGHGPWWLTVMCVFLQGMVGSFMINAVHELGHGTVFRTRELNVFFTHLFAFFGWVNHETFQSSHIRHHRYTLHPPDDLEVTLPIRIVIRRIFLTGFFDPSPIWNTVRNMARIACGRFEGEWELTLYPATAPEKRAVPVRWARAQFAGHAAIAVVSAFGHWWIVPLLFSLPVFCGSWLLQLCNDTQHIGLQDNVSDFRLCCRTFTLNPVTRFLYWQMNYHIEHHMYAAVPCYNLDRLHRLIRHDLPPCPHGLVEVWKEIASIQARQAVDPTYQHRAAIPSVSN